MTLQDFLDYVETGAEIAFGSAYHRFMTQSYEETARACAELNSGWHSMAENRAIFARIIGRELPEDFAVFPPFTADFGKNIHIAKGVFINSGCRFQDHGGIWLGEGVQIGHNVVMATLNHALAPSRRKNMLPRPIVLERNVWVGSQCTILPAVRVGESAVLGAGAVVTRDVEPFTVVAGNPARVIRRVLPSA